jgi:hypothetical protein
MKALVKTLERPGSQPGHEKWRPPQIVSERKVAGSEALLEREKISNQNIPRFPHLTRVPFKKQRSRCLISQTTMARSRYQFCLLRGKG